MPIGLLLELSRYYETSPTLTALVWQALPVLTFTAEWLQRRCFGRTHAVIVELCQFPSATVSHPSANPSAPRQPPYRTGCRNGLRPREAPFGDQYPWYGRGEHSFVHDVTQGSP